MSRLLGPTPGSETLCGSPKRWWDGGAVGQRERRDPRLPLPRGPRSIAVTDLPDVSPGRFSTADPRLWRWSPATAH